MQFASESIPPYHRPMGSFQSIKLNFLKIIGFFGIDSYKAYTLKTKIISRIYASKTFCPLPWNHFSVSTTQEMRLCCNNEGQNQVRDEDGNPLLFGEIKSLKDYFNTPFMKKIRLQMLRGEEPSACKKCFDYEKAGGSSLRQSFQHVYTKQVRETVKGTAKDGSIKVNVKYLDLSMGNNCNIACRMCGPTSSTKLKEDFEAGGHYYDREKFHRASTGWSLENLPEKIIKETLETTDKILVTGGEPFVIESHYRLLEMAIESGRSQDMTLAYHTNLSLLPKRLIEQWRHFKYIRVNGSIEGVRELNDYVRYPSKWRLIDQNLRKLLELKKELPLWVEVHSVFQAYSLSRTIELLEYLKGFNKQMPAFPFFNYLNTPEALKVNVLPFTLRKMYGDKIQKYIDSNQNFYKDPDSPFSDINKFNMDTFAGCLELMLQSNEEERWPEFLAYNNKMDQRRNQSIEKVLPELFGSESEDLNQGRFQSL